MKLAVKRPFRTSSNVSQSRPGAAAAAPHRADSSHTGDAVARYQSWASSRARPKAPTSRRVWNRRRARRPTPSARLGKRWPNTRECRARAAADRLADRSRAAPCSDWPSIAPGRRGRHHCGTTRSWSSPAMRRRGSGREGSITSPMSKPSSKNPERIARLFGGLQSSLAIA